MTSLHRSIGFLKFFFKSPQTRINTANFFSWVWVSGVDFGVGSSRIGQEKQNLHYIGNDGIMTA